MGVSTWLPRLVRFAFCVRAERLWRFMPGPANTLPLAVIVKRFFFPSWYLDPALPLSASEPLRLISFSAPAGNHTYALQRAALTDEKVGWTISGLSLVLLLAWAALAWRRVRFT